MSAARPLNPRAPLDQASPEPTSRPARGDAPPAPDRGATSAGPLDLSIIICTFQRPDLLRDALTSCATQALPLPRRYEVIVVDNCPMRSAAATVEAVRAALGPTGAAIRYAPEPRTNLAHARNAGVAASRARYVAFVDDDNIAPPHWAATALDMMDETAADVLFGDVEPVFPPETDPQNIAAAGDYFRRRIAAPEGAPIPITSAGHVPGARTCNVVLRRRRCFPPNEPWFDPAFGLSGGEDTDFFMRLAQRLPGDGFRTSSRALMQEVIPPARVEPDIVVRRAFVGSQRLAWALIRNSPSPPATWAALTAIALAQIALAGARLGLSGLRGDAPPLARRVAFARAAGKLAHAALAKTASPHR